MPVKKVVNNVVWYGGLALLAYMPFHILLSQSISTVTGGLDAWKIAKDVVLYVVAAKAFYVCLRAGYFKKVFFKRITTLFIAYGLLHVVVALAHPANNQQDALLGIIYNLRIPAAFYIGAAMAIVRPAKQAQATVIKVIMAASAAVAVLGVVQYFLPKDTLTHLGYSVTRGVKPNFFIDDKPDLPRIMSTMRDPNTLGAFLVLPLLLMANAIKNSKHKMWLYGGITAMALCLLLTYSRSALLGLIIALCLYGILQNRQTTARLLRKYGLLAAVLVLVAMASLFAARNTYFVQNTVLHSDKSTKQRDSNGLHLDFAKNAIKQIAKQPLGHGPGTAGLVSIRDKKSVVLTEDYYLQIAYEVGVVGLLLLVGILYMVALQLWRIRQLNSQAVTLLAVLAGLSFINLLLHMWSGEAVVLYWWLLAGVVISKSTTTTSKPR